MAPRVLGRVRVMGPEGEEDEWVGREERGQWQWRRRRL
jgi:hypothetical protein